MDRHLAERAETTKGVGINKYLRTIQSVRYQSPHAGVHTYWDRKVGQR